MNNKLVKNFFSFPVMINDVSARFVAFFVVIICSLLLLSTIYNSDLTLYISIFLSYGFLARFSSGPKASPIALLVTKIIVPRLSFKEKLFPGPPKRFAQFIGMVFSFSITTFILLDLEVLVIIFTSVLIFFASLEAFLGYCFGCRVFKFLISMNLLPKEICERCNDIEF
ncbi:MAG: hypothetical protein CL746_06790 [Chloroflexi bacterium]|nr:hypothetical protein [Chloroflexota bacterium]MBC64000.1 hypothetical protein [Chloroflexota bacterium]MBL01460.1 hypothetical protein [Chloroflexota bacterium]